MNRLFISLFLLLCLIMSHANGLFGTDRDILFVEHGDSVTLHTGVKTNQQDRIVWFYKGSRIAELSGDLSVICTDVQCNDTGAERFKGKLNLDHQTGSLTIMNITNTDVGGYRLKIFRTSGSRREKFFTVVIDRVSAFDSDKVSVKEGDSVTLHTGVKMDQQNFIRWYYNTINIAEISGDLSFICADVECDNGAEGFRDRLKLDHQTGSLTITDTSFRDEGEYEVVISSTSGRVSVKIFTVSVIPGVSAVDSDKVSVNAGDSVTLHTGVKTNQQNFIRWYYYMINIAEISGDLSFICTDVECNNDTEGFRDRLKLDHQTGSLTITDTSFRDEGEYEVVISSTSGRVSVKIFTVSVFPEVIICTYPYPGSSPAVIIAAAVLLLAAVISGVTCCCCKCKSKKEKIQVIYSLKHSGSVHTNSGVWC